MPEQTAPLAVETAPAAPAPVPVAASAEPVSSAYSGVTAKPEDILKNLGGEGGLSQVETQSSVLPSIEGEAGAASSRRPRRRHPQQAAPAQMELMQVETSTPAAPAATAVEDTTPRSHGPGRRRRASSQAVANEPLVQVETQQ
jgi:hypothetical protein